MVADWGSATRRGATQQEIGQQRHGPSGTALGAAAHVSRTGDVHMRPAQTLGEACEERARGDRAAVTTGDVGEVCEVALELLAILFGERQLPSPIIGAQA